MDSSPRPLVRRRVPAVAAALVLALVAAACGGDGTSSTGQPDPEDINAEVASFDIAAGGPSRLLVGVISNDQRFVVFGSVQLRFAYLGTAQAREEGTFGAPVAGRFLPVPGVVVPSPAPASPQLASGSEVRGVYSAQATFPKAGIYQVEVTADVAGRERTTTAAFTVGERNIVPTVGEPALATENLTIASTDAPRGAIDSRAAAGGEVPDPHIHSTTVAAALAAGRPAVVVFSTPVYCVSRFCGPITEMIADLAHTYGDRASFVHIEIWRDFQNQTINRAAADWLLREGNLNEPWVFVIGADGVIQARFDNVATEQEIVPLLQPLPIIGPA